MLQEAVKSETPSPDTWPDNKRYMDHQTAASFLGGIFLGLSLELASHGRNKEAAASAALGLTFSSLSLANIWDVKKGMRPIKDLWREAVFPVTCNAVYGAVAGIGAFLVGAAYATDRKELAAVVAVVGLASLGMSRVCVGAARHYTNYYKNRTPALNQG